MIQEVQLKRTDFFIHMDIPYICVCVCVCVCARARVYMR